MENVKNILLDLGGVLYDLDYQLTQSGLEKLGCGRNFSKLDQGAIFDDIEEGKISKVDFLSALQEISELDPKPSLQSIEDAWNAMLIGIPNSVFGLLKRLKAKYRLFLFSNTNEIHIDQVWKHLREVHGKNDLSEYFEHVYLSNELGLRKPKPEAFTRIIKEQGLEAQETLFVDDSPQHVKGAKKAGLQALWLDLEVQKFPDLLRDQALL